MSVSREHAPTPALDLLAVLTEHCGHPDASTIAAELGLRIALLGGIASGTLPLGPDHAHTLIFGVRETPAS